MLNSASSLGERTILTLLIDTGLRSSEVASLRKQDIKAESVTVRAKCGEREVPISDDVPTLVGRGTNF